MIYRIYKILNNNVITSKDGKGNEIIVTGNGVGFGTKVGNDVPNDRIQNVFVPESKAFLNRFVKLVNEISYECFNIAEDIKILAEEDLGVKLDEILVISLADHINFALCQYDKKQPRSILMTDEINRFYPDEYRAGKKAVKLIEDKFGITCDKAEAGTIAFHIINSQVEGGSNDVIKIVQSTKDIIEIIETTMHIKFIEDTMDYSRMIIHLKFFLKRVLSHSTKNEQFGQLLLNPDEGSLQGISESLNTIADYMLKTYHHKIDESERVYLLIHIVRVIESQNNE